VSTVGNNQEAGFQAQLRDLKAIGCEKIYKEKVSSVAERKQLDEVLSYVRAGDTLIVCKLDRLARSTKHLLQIIDTLDGKGVALRILDFGGSSVDTSSATGRLMLTMFGAMAEFERALMLERQREGIAKAKADGKYRGRQPTAKAKSVEVYALADKGMKAIAIAEKLAIGKSSVYRILADR
jgi:DNA invertase Pin-like site-specific DNA recombinase